MAKKPNQKLKILYLMKILLEKTDEKHLLTSQQIIEELSLYGINAERKSIYDDIEALRTFGIDIEMVKGKPTGYHILSRTFQLPELKLLVDGVQSCKFITYKKSMELIKKLESFASTYESQQLRRQIYVSNRIKCMNESIYYNVDKLHNAITANQQISFKYFQYTPDKECQFKKGGLPYQVSPFALTFDNENYYLVAFDAENDIIKHYRVDKMTELNLCAEERLGQDRFRAFDMAIYERKLFSMFNGQEYQLKISFANYLAGVVIDRFGKEVKIAHKDEDKFTAVVQVMLSPKFYGWLFAMGQDAKILEPPAVIADMKRHLQELIDIY